MKTIIKLLFVLNSIFAFGQAPTISSHMTLCINDTPPVVIVDDIEYDSYQWYYMVTYEDEPEYLPIEGATGRTLDVNLDYNAYMVKVVVTKDGETYESNEVYLEAMWFTGILMQVDHEDPNYYQNENGGNMCYGYRMRLEILYPWNYRVMWQKDGEIIEGETNTVFYATETGSYNALCAHELCPNDLFYSLGSSITFNNCQLATADIKNNNDLTIYPNPSAKYLFVKNFKKHEIDAYEIYNSNGQLVSYKSNFNSSQLIDVQNLTEGTYFIKLKSNSKTVTLKFIKK